MELNVLYKVVYEEDRETKVIKGILVHEDEHTITISLNQDKHITIGKRYLQKATNIIGDFV